MEDDFVLLDGKVAALENYSLMDPIPVEEAIKADMAFHLSIIEIARNSALAEFGKLIMRLFQNSMIAHIATPQGIRRAVEDHRAIRSRDREKARTMIIQSLLVWKDYISLQGKT